MLRSPGRFPNNLIQWKRWERYRNTDDLLCLRDTTKNAGQCPEGGSQTCRQTHGSHASPGKQ